MKNSLLENTAVDNFAKVLWDYHLMGHELRKMDCIFVLGSHDLRVAEHAADLYFEGWAPILIFSGNKGRMTEGLFEDTEARILSQVAIAKGVPEDCIYLENEATNTGENIAFTRNLIERESLDIKSFILVQKPFMERRTYASFKKVWPEKEILISSPRLSFDDYFMDVHNKDEIINAMVGDLQRIKEYPAKGFQIQQEIPSSVWSAFEGLCKLGYDKHLI
ncbi:YdcF family protein [Lentisphaera profundi]|uniref:YdcF family protein n=1 Tax=Lentisphaera profundi TaxID=1658616 RepID=A0ABY7VPW5_9BACT|nr:YdcF family protein [Lentisphaera profundi]WDE95752.1 YdcF family protein [Lentisphaera profundi]